MTEGFRYIIPDYVSALRISSYILDLAARCRVAALERDCAKTTEAMADIHNSVHWFYDYLVEEQNND